MLVIREEGCPASGAPTGGCPSGGTSGGDGGCVGGPNNSCTNSNNIPNTVAYIPWGIPNTDYNKKKKKKDKLNLLEISEEDGAPRRCVNCGSNEYSYQDNTCHYCGGETVPTGEPRPLTAEEERELRIQELVAYQNGPNYIVYDRNRGIHNNMAWVVCTDGHVRERNLDNRMGDIRYMDKWNAEGCARNIHYLSRDGRRIQLNMQALGV